MEEWKEYKLIDVLDALIDYRGKTPKKVEKGIPLITAKIVKNGRINAPNEFLAEEDYDNWMVRGFPNAGDVVLTTEAPLGEVAQLDERKVALAQRIVTLRGKKNVLDNTYLKYYLLSNIGQSRLKARETGTTVTGIKQSELREVLVTCPPFETQQKIANILSSLDDKIEVNRRINEQLEELAQALFKSWFVDFEPFKDGEFVESELGMIPEGWKVCELKDFGQIICGKTPSKDNKDFYGGNIPFIKIPDIHNNIFVWNTTDWLSNKGDASQVNKRIPPYSICVSCIATVGLVAINTTFAHTNQQINTIIPNNAFERYYLFEQLKSMKEYIQNLGRGGTATLNVNTRLFGSIKVLRPSEKVLKEYDDVINGFFKKIELNQQEITHLTNLRDTLLPKLMSGEIDVNEVKI